MVFQHPNFTFKFTKNLSNIILKYMMYVKFIDENEMFL